MTNHTDQLRDLSLRFQSELAEANSPALLEELKVRYLGKKGPVQALMTLLRDVPENERPQFGKAVNDLKCEIADQLENKLLEVASKALEDRLKHETQDITLPGRQERLGRPHVVAAALDEMIDILIGMGFSVQYGPDIESDYYNFEALNFPHDHPARDMQDTFYISPSMLLRTHTSNTQVRIMEQHKPPLRIIAPGKAYRNETITARSHVFFHQVEAFYIDKGVTFSDLVSTLNEFLIKLFDEKVEVRFRPSYFPFVEPGMEVDVRCMSCQGAGCPLCKMTGWLEVLGAGMIHPEVLRNGGIDPEEYTGFAWGMGVERLVMLKHGIKDIRQFWDNDQRFLSQFNGRG